MRSQIWISLIHGSQGIMFFAHGVHPEDGSFWDLALHHDKPQLAAVGRLTAEVHALAPVLNSAELGGRVARVKSSMPASAELAEHDLEPIAISCRYHDGDFYIFAARMEGYPAEGMFTITVPEKLPAGTTVEVLNENRSVPLDGTEFKDSFNGYDIHLYKLRMTGCLIH